MLCMNTNYFLLRRTFLAQVLLILSSLALLLSTSIAHCAEIIDATLDAGLMEKHEPEVKVSGNVIVGVMSSSANHGLMKNLLAVQSTAENAGRTLCLKVTSRDGIYTSTNKYSLGSSLDAIIRLPYKSSYQSVINEYSRSKGDVAMTTAFGSCDQAATGDYYLPAKLNRKKQSLSSGSISIYVNGFDATDVSFELNKEDIFQDCEYIEEGRHTAYNFVCEIPKSLISKSGYPLAVEISREAFGRELSQTTINIFAE